MDALQRDKRYTYADYAGWDDDARYELIGGVATMMAPAPSDVHQTISGGLFGQFWLYLRGKPCKVYHAPFDVRLNAGNGDDTVLQPDILVVCDQSKLDGKSCVGAPDLVIEILSPASARRDRLVKFQLYRQAGVREYWIADPETKTVAVHLLENGKYTTSVYGDTDTVAVHVLDGCVICLPDVFTA